MKTIHWALVASGVALLVTGCGGGSETAGDSAILTAPVQINATNAPVVAKGAMTPAQGMAGSGSSMSGIVGVVTETSAHTRSVLDISLAKFAELRGMQLAPATGVVGVIAGYPMNIPCALGGTMGMNVQDTNSNATVDAGDVLIVTFTSCKDNLSTQDGSMTFAIGDLSAAGTGTPAAPRTAAFTVTFSNYSTKYNATSQTDLVNGDISFTTSDDGTNTTGTMSGTSVSMTTSAEGAFAITNYSFNFMEANTPTATTPYSFSATFTTGSGFVRGSVTVTTPTAFTGLGTGNPTSGVMVVTGANNSTLTLTANADGVHVQQVVDDDGVAGPHAPATVTPDTTWNAI